MTNILEAIATIINHPIPDLLSSKAFESFVKDAFANAINEPEPSKPEKYDEVFSWIRTTQSNPPNLMIRNGDAIEVYKIQSPKGSIQLNSSYPKSKLFSDNPQITLVCRECETWTEKDIIYAIGVISKEHLKTLWLIYGDCYAASQEYYEGIKDQIASGINAIADIEFSETEELGRVNKVDPLSITSLRIRPMWLINNPSTVFDYVDTGYDPKKNFQIIAIMKESKYLSFPLDSRTKIESISVPGFNINTQSIKCPDNPGNLIPAKIITYKI
ncbi:NgoPII family restriction endonuclease [Microcoleus sp. N9_B2]|uniref:NgoPII family restriction endonuclease n=1 Tax=unclassified Microcoleus TaxID=2642155 RepID=UPI002FD5ED96